jgi:hypothetical protein
VPAAVVRGDILDPSGVEIGALLREEELDSMTMQRLCERLEALGAERNRTSTQAQ